MQNGEIKIFKNTGWRVRDYIVKRPDMYCQCPRRRVEKEWWRGNMKMAEKFLEIMKYKNPQAFKNTKKWRKRKGKGKKNYT